MLKFNIDTSLEDTTVDENLNTSHVKVQHSKVLATSSTCFNLNTSHVKVQQYPSPRWIC